MHHQPGGHQSHNIFGNDPAADADRFGGRGMNKAAVPVVPSVPVQAPEQTEEEKEPEQAQAQAVAGMKNAQPAHTSIKVNNPPGGRSQISFG